MSSFGPRRLQPPDLDLILPWHMLELWCIAACASADDLWQGRRVATEREIIRRFEEAQNALVLQASDLSLETIAAMVDSEAIDVKPLFQRRERWDARRQSSLIESFILNIPIPPVYLSEERYGDYSVIDGKQRITAINLFMRDRLHIRGVERFPELNGCSFSDLPSPLRNALTVRPYVRAITILNQSDKSIKYEVFHRLNSGGEPLNAQEIRNVIYRGPLNKLIMDLSEATFLKKKLKIRNDRASAYQQMADAEFVLRFFTLRDLGSFGGDLRQAMDTFMENKAAPPESELERLRARFERALHLCEIIWGDVAFKRPEKQTWRDQTLAGMYDAQMLAVDSISDDTAKRAAEKALEVVDRTREMFNDEQFSDAVRTATNTPQKLDYRVSATIEMLERI